MSTMLTIWIVFSVLSLAGVIAVFVWAIRSRQFSGQDRARYLALQSGIPEDRASGAAADENASTNGRPD